MAFSIRIISFLVHEDYRFSYSEIVLCRVLSCSFLSRPKSYGVDIVQCLLHLDTLLCALPQWRKLRRKIFIFDHKQHVLIKIYLLILLSASYPPFTLQNLIFLWLSHSQSMLNIVVNFYDMFVSRYISSLYGALRPQFSNCNTKANQS